METTIVSEKKLTNNDNKGSTAKTGTSDATPFLSVLFNKHFNMKVFVL